MAHENSKTYQGIFQNMDGTRNIGYYNTLGNNPYNHLEKLHPFEKDNYLTKQEAVKAAELRSNIHHLENPLGAPYFDKMYNGEGFLGDKPIDMSLGPKPKSVWGKFIDWYTGNQMNNGRFPADGNY